jgi:MYXO-CTERM domain-containing protein
MTRLAWPLAVALGIGLLTPSSARADRIVFINTEPTVLVNTAGQDPTQDSYTSNGFMPGPISGWPALTQEQRDELVFWMREATVPFDITFTFTRPQAVPYDMVVMGDDLDNAALFPDLGCTGAIGLADCGDLNAENISFLFWACLPMDQQSDMKRVAFNTLTALGFGWGLENVTASGQIGGGYTSNGVHFGESCVSTQGTTCTDHIGCMPGQQNSTADLTARIGARVDNGPPTVTITSPLPGDNPADFTVSADVADTYGGLTVTLSIVEAAAEEMSDPMPPYEWNLAGVPAGEWTIQVSAIDADLNETVETVTVCVDEPDCSVVSGGTGTSTGGDTAGADGGSTYGDVFEETTEGDGDPPSDGGTSTTGPVDPTTPGQVTTFGGGEPETGCGCRGGGSGGGPGGLLAVVAWLGLRRRRVTRPG